MVVMISLRKNWSSRMVHQTIALYFSYRDPRTPWYARWFAAYVFIRTVSPIDLIPDFIPVIGYLDDLILTPLGIWLAIKIIPKDVLEEARRKANETSISDLPHAKWYIILVILFWVLLLTALLWASFPVIIKILR